MEPAAPISEPQDHSEPEDELMDACSTDPEQLRPAFERPQDEMSAQLGTEDLVENTPEQKKKHPNR